LTLEELSRPHASSGHRRKKGRRQPRQVARH
jgi:hypothetical protein